MMAIFIVGNGESRKNFDLSLLRGKGPIFGCNALYRDFDPDYIVSLDRPMVLEILEAVGSGKLITTKLAFPLQKAKQDTPSKSIKRDRLALLNEEVLTSVEVPCHNSGMFATFVACKMFPSPQNVYLVGFDFHNERSNLYSGTLNYGQSFVKFQSEQWKEIFNFFPDASFIRIGDPDPVYSKLELRTLSFSAFQFLLSTNNV